MREQAPPKDTRKRSGKSEVSQEQHQSSSKPPWRLETANLATTVVFFLSKMHYLGQSGTAGKTNAAAGNGFKTGRPQSPQHWTARPKLARDLAKLQEAAPKDTRERSWESEIGQEQHQRSSKPPWRLEIANLAKTIVFLCQICRFWHTPVEPAKRYTAPEMVSRPADRSLHSTEQRGPSSPETLQSSRSRP